MSYYVTIQKSKKLGKYLISSCYLGVGVGVPKPKQGYLHLLVYIDCKRKVTKTKGKGKACLHLFTKNFITQC